MKKNIENENEYSKPDIYMHVLVDGEIIKTRKLTDTEVRSRYLQMIDEAPIEEYSNNKTQLILDALNKIANKLDINLKENGPEELPVDPEFDKKIERYFITNLKRIVNIMKIASDKNYGTYALAKLFEAK